MDWTKRSKQIKAEINGDIDEIIKAYQPCEIKKHFYCRLNDKLFIEHGFDKVKITVEGKTILFIKHKNIWDKE